MGVLDRVRTFIARSADAPVTPRARADGTTESTAPAPASVVTKKLGSGRLSVDDSFLPFTSRPFQAIIPPDGTSDEWRRLSLDESVTRGISTNRLLRLLADLSPDVSRALWDFLRLCNPGWEVTVTKYGTETISRDGKKLIDNFLRRLRENHGAVDIPIGKLHFAAFLRGALLAELVLDDRGRTAIDLATPDPTSIRFRLQNDPLRGQIWELGQFQSTKGFVSLADRRGVFYLPVDPAPGVAPYGRPPAAPSIFTSLFLLGMLHDLRRVIAMQGYPHHDIEVELEALMPLVPPEVFTDKKQLKLWVDNFIAEIADAYDKVEPDSVFVHVKGIQVNWVNGAVSSDSLRAVDGLIKGLERMLARALKTMPLLFGSLEGASEANATRQWELQAASVKSIQHLSETLLSDACTLVCEAEGVDAVANWKFAELRAAELYRDAMTNGLQTKTAIEHWLMGWKSQEQASQAATGHDPDQKEPRFIPSMNVPLDQANSARRDGNPPGGDGGGSGKKSDDSAPADGNNNDPNARATLDVEVTWAQPELVPLVGLLSDTRNGNGHSLYPVPPEPPQLDHPG